MAQIKRGELTSFLENKEELTGCKIILIFGERYLCREAGDAVQNALLEDETGGAVYPIDGDQENPGQTLAKLVSFSLLPGKQIYRVTDSGIFHSRTVASDIWEKSEAAHRSGKEHAAMRHIVSFAKIGSLAMESQKPFSELSDSGWQKQFGFAKPAGDIGWADNLFVTAIGTGKIGTGEATNIADRVIETFSSTIPPSNYLILTAETVDKKQRLFTFIKKNGMVIDCSVASGAASAAQKQQKDVLRELVHNTLNEFGKKIEPQALEIFFERVGFHPVAVVNETEKLALFADDRDFITSEDLDTMVARSREDALYELTDAFGKRQVSKTLIILKRLQDNGTHGLAILASMRNFIRKLLILRSIQLQPSPHYQKGMNAKQFQNSYLPSLKESEQWQEHLGGHPYALFMSFSKAADFSCYQLKNWLKLLLEAEFRLKGSPLPPQMVLEELFLSLFRQKKNAK
jgi:DNA polymerase III subunit delta